MDKHQPRQQNLFCKNFQKRISRSNDHDVPLPNPFPLPQNYRADVAAALEASQITADTKKAFF